LRTSRSSTGDGAELATNSSGRMRVKNLYTFGAPQTGGPALADPLSGDGCFPGLRLVNKESTWLLTKVDIVPPLLKSSVYAHTKADIGFLYGGNRLDTKSCGWWGLTPETPSLALHNIDLYVSRTAARYPHLRDMANVALASSYNDNEKSVAELVRAQGYGLVASAVCERCRTTDEDEVSHLIQNPRTLDCWLTFEGSDNSNDWINNLKLFRTPFCGLEQQVHTGFRNATMAMVLEPNFQEKVRPKIGHCKSVEVLGHSLGGSIAGLFTACAHSKVRPGARGYDEFEKIYFEKKETKLMDFL